MRKRDIVLAVCFYAVLGVAAIAAGTAANIYLPDEPEFVAYR